VSFAARMQKTADKLLNKFDEREVKIILRSAGARVFSEALGEFVIEPSSESTLTGVATTYNQSLVNGATVQSGDIQLVVTRAVEINQSDKVFMDNVEYSIIAIDPIAYTGKDLTIAYKVQLRR